MPRPTPALLVLACLAACTAERPALAPAPEPARPVRAARVEARDYAEKVVATGQLTGSNEALLSFKIGGLVRRVAVEAGDRVNKGQLLASLDAAEIGAQVRQAREGLAKAQRDRARAERLFGQQVATRAELDDASTGMEVARSALAIAEFNARHARILAPAEGRVLRRFAQENELVGPGQPIVQLQGGSEDWVVKVGLPDVDAVRVRVGDSALVWLSALPAERLEARVSEIAPAAAPATGTFLTELRVQAPSSRLLSGMVARAEIAPSQREPLLFVPLAALVRADGRRGAVFVIGEGGLVRLREVEVASWDGGLLAVRSGLRAGEEVVSEGAAYLRDGQKVRVTRP